MKNGEPSGLGVWWMTALVCSPLSVRPISGQLKVEEEPTGRLGYQTGPTYRGSWTRKMSICTPPNPGILPMVSFPPLKFRSLADMNSKAHILRCRVRRRRGIRENL